MPKISFSPKLLGKAGLIGFALFAPLSIALSQICIGLTLLGWFGESLVQRKFIWKRTPLDYPILIYLIFQFIAVLRADVFLDGLNGWIDTDWFILLYYGVINTIDSEEDFSLILRVLIISGITSAFYGIWQHFEGWDYIRNRRLPVRGDYFRAGGFVAFPLTYGGIQLTILCLVTPFIFLWKETKKRILFLIPLLILFLSFVVSFARSSWMGFGLVVIFAIFFWGRKNAWLIAGFILVAAVAINLIYPDNIYKSIFISIFNASGDATFSNQVRINLWKTAVRIIEDHPLFGIGYNNYYRFFEIYKVPFDFRGLRAPHNDILHVTAISGIFGGLAFLSIWVTALYKTFREMIKYRIPENIAQALVIGSFFVILALLFGGLTQEYYRDAENSQLWWFAAALGIKSLLNLNQTENTDV